MIKIKYYNVIPTLTILKKKVESINIRMHKLLPCTFSYA